jgi:hypothetical protein
LGFGNPTIPLLTLTPGFVPPFRKYIIVDRVVRMPNGKGINTGGQEAIM